MAVATAVLEVIEEENLQGKALMLGSYLMNKLLELQKLYPVIGDVRGCGLMIGVEFVKVESDREPNPTLAKMVLER